MTILILLLHWYKGDLSPDITIHYLSGLLNGREKNLANTDLWFLPSLFLTSIAAYIILLKTPKTKLTHIAILFFLILLIYFTDRKGNSIYSVTTVPVALFFFLAGYLYRKKDFYIEKWQSLVYYSIFVIGIFSISFYTIHQTVDIGANYFGKSIPLMLLNGLLGTLLIIFLSRKIHSNTILEYLGGISLYIFIFHQIFVPVTDSFNSFFGIEKNFIIISTIKLLGSIALYEWAVKPLKKKIKFI